MWSRKHCEIWIQSIKFFRSRLLILDHQEIGEEIKRLESESDSIKDSVINLCWWMRGGITHSEAWNLTEKERSMVTRLIKNNLETMKKNKNQINLI